MKRLFYLLLLILMGSYTIQAQRIIENPTYDFKNSGINKITKIELGTDSTRIYMRCTYSHNWWVSIDSTITLKNSNGNEIYPIISVKGTEFGKQSFTPKCGYQDFVLNFGSIKEDIAEIDYITENGKWNILGIKLAEQQKDKGENFPEAIQGNWSDISGEKGWTYGFYPSFAIIGHQFWTYSNIKKTRKGYQLSLQCDDKTKELYLTIKDTLLAIGESKKEQQLYTLGTQISEESEAIDLKIDPLQSGEMVLQGFIDGYHPKANFKTDYANVEDVIHDVDIESLFEIQPDGRFSAKLNLAHAGHFYFTIDKHYINFLAVPNDTLTIYINWEGLIESDCHPNNNYYHSAHSRYMGKYGRLNSEINALLQFSKYDWGKNRKNLRLDFQTFYKETMKDFRLDSIRLEEQLIKNNTLLITKELSRLNLITGYIEGGLFEYTIYGDKLVRKEYIGQKYKKSYEDCSLIPENFHNLLKYIDVSDPKIALTKSFSGLISRYAHAPFFSLYNVNWRADNNLNYINKQGLLNAKEQEVLSQLKQHYDNPTNLDSIQIVQLFKETYDILKKYPKESKQSSDQMLLYIIKKDWAELDSISKTFWNEHNNIIQQIAVYNKWLFYQSFGEIGKRGGSKKSSELQQNINKLAKEYITIPFLRENMDKDINNALKSKEIKKIPEGAGNDLFQKIIAPHKGKYILIDFWATWCGPCVMGIEESQDLRTSLKDKNIAFVFITNPSSPLGRYNKIMKDVVGDKHRLSNDEYKVLQRLFNVNSIPRYILVDTEGKIIDDKFYISNLESKLKDLGVIN